MKTHQGFGIEAMRYPGFRLIQLRNHTASI